MSDTKRKYYKPGRENGKFVLRRTDEDGNTLPSVEIGPEGYSTKDPEIISALDEHILKGHRDGYVEIESPRLTRQKKQAAQQAQANTQKAEAKPGKKTKSPKGTVIGNYRIEDKGGGYKNVVHIESGKVQNDTGLRPDDAEALAKELSELETPEAEDTGNSGDSGGGDEITPEDVTNINQAKDWVQKQPGIDGRTLTSKKKILEAAASLDPPVEFPNLD